MKVLRVEDDLDLSDALSQVLSARGFQVVCCADGLEALAMARRHAFDAIVLDLTLPGIDGLDLLQRLRDDQNEERAAVPVLVVTARGAVGERVQGLEGGADDHLAQTFEVTELVARLRALMRRSHAVSKDSLHEAVFGAGASEAADAVEVLVHRLRKRIAGRAVELVTLRGVGYLLIDEAVMAKTP